MDYEVTESVNHGSGDHVKFFHVSVPKWKNCGCAVIYSEL